MKIIIENARVDEAESLVDVYRDVYEENEKLGLPASASKVSIQEVQHWINESILVTAKEAGSFHILGTVRLKYHRDWQCYVLSRLAVKSAYKGLGIGTNLMKDGEKILSKMGEIKIRLTVAQSHPYLVKMYEKKGYEIVEERFLPDLPYDEFVMEKSL